jgi:F-type H+-transporting ATPase subunit b
VITTFAAEEASGIASLGLNLKTFIFQMIAFGIVVVVLNKYALPKIFAAIDKRREEIEEGLKTAEAAKAALTSADAEVEKILDKARTEANDILATTQKEAASIIAEAEEKASRRAKSIIADAETSMHNQIEAARTALKAETRQLVAQATETILLEKLDAAKDGKLIERALEEAKA